MSLRAFGNGYWYLSDLVEFGRKLGLPAAHRMRKDELESAIKICLATGRLPETITSRPVKKGVTDLERGLALDLVIANYTSNRQTKNFIAHAAKRKSPWIKEKSGVWYRLNRWREAQTARRPVTYGDLVDEYIAPIVSNGSSASLTGGINFVADYLAAEKDASREDAIAAWKQLKDMSVPKTFDSWRKVSGKRRRRQRTYGRERWQGGHEPT